MNKTITISLSKDEALILSDYLSKRIDNPDTGKVAFDMSNPDFGEKVALSNLNTHLEPLIDVVFSADYNNHLADAKRAITKELTPEAWGE